MKSAEQAGFFNSGKDRLVKPPVQSLKAKGADNDAAEESMTNQDKEQEGGNHEESGGKGGGGGQFPPDLDQIIAGLIARLPKSGSEWPESERTLWLGVLESSFSLVYKDSGS